MERYKPQRLLFNKKSKFLFGFYFFFRECVPYVYHHEIEKPASYSFTGI